MIPLTRQFWSPYLVGVGIGVLSWFSFATADRQLGITTAFEYSAALTEQAMADYGKVTLPQLTSSSPWLWVSALVALIVIALALIQRLHPKQLNSKL